VIGLGKESECLGPHPPEFSPGAVVATSVWLAVSVGGFTIYAANFARYNETYGALGAVVVVMLWLYIGAYVTVAGADLNAELERQTPWRRRFMRRRLELGLPVRPDALAAASNKDELLEEARLAGVEGAASLTKDELAEALSARMTS
jgi:uncharacterized BrkB/YihY/UPF0761 family membrane protein